MLKLPDLRQGIDITLFWHSDVTTNWTFDVTFGMMIGDILNTFEAELVSASQKSGVIEMFHTNRTLTQVLQSVTTDITGHFRITIYSSPYATRRLNAQMNMRRFALK